MGTGACTEVKSEKYQTRKSPAYHAGDCKGDTKEGKDGNYISKADTRGIYRWIKINATRKNKGPKGKQYRTHDNGRTSYIVFDLGKSIEVYRTDFDEAAP